MQRIVGLSAFALTCLSACPRGKIVPTTSELVQGSSYLPLSPKPVRIDPSGPHAPVDLLDSLPNETMRVSIGSLDQTGSFTFGAGSVGEEGHSYEVVVDYIKYTTTYLPACYKSYEVSNSGRYVAGQQRVDIRTEFGGIGVLTDNSVAGQTRVANESKFSMSLRIPVYVGVGMRIRAQVLVLKGKVQLSLFGLGAAADAGRVSGSMTIQTLGVFGAAISPLIPLPSDISQASIQGAMQSLAAIKAKLYDTSGVKIRPQVVGFETTFPQPAVVQLLDATLAGSHVNATLKDGELHSLPIGSPEFKCDDEKSAQAVDAATAAPARNAE